MKDRALFLGVAVAVPLLTASAAGADRLEATVAVRPTGAVARLPEAGATDAAQPAGGGVTGGLSWGLRNWLDVGAELAALTFAPARYTGATESLSGTPGMGDVERTTRLAQLRLGATLRLGVAWVPTVYVGVGGGARLRTTAAFTPMGANGSLTPDDGAAATTFDVVTTARVGLDHRLGARWTIGVAVGATHCFGVGAPDINVFEGTASVSYTWYPLW
jgi:hypothetical protein